MTEQPTREQIRDLVTTDPGVHFNAVVRRLDITPGQAQYHIRRLQGSNVVTAESRYGRTHYYTEVFDARERHAIAVLRRETARDITTFVLAEASVRPRAVAESLGIARSTLEYHLGHLEAADLVRKRHDDAGCVSLHAPRPSETVRLLELVTPSLPERLVDRFERLVDTL